MRSGCERRDTEPAHLFLGRTKPCQKTKRSALVRTKRSREDVRELLEIEEADAWLEYLRVTRDAPESCYANVELWAWARLCARLRSIRVKRAELVPVA